MSTGHYPGVRHCRDGMAYHLANDSDLLEVYVSNVANFLLDHGGLKDRAEANKKAVHLLELLFTT